MVAGRKQPSPERQARYRRGLTAEVLAVAYLVAKGHRILARRYKTGVGEIDLIAKSGRRVAFIEVKRRPTLEDAEASVTEKQRNRVRRAASLWLGQHKSYQEHDLGFDLIFILPRRWPVYLRDAL